MEADWEVEIGGEAPVIDAYWPGLVDLRVAPERISDISETKLQPGLAQALLRLNILHSPVWTSKCDLFEPEKIEAGELDGGAEEVTHGRSCYIDLLAREARAWRSLSEIEGACRHVCERLRRVQLAGCRVDLVVRRAVVKEGEALGITVYLTGCGSTVQGAKGRLGECLIAFAETAAAGVIPE